MNTKIKKRNSQKITGNRHRRLEVVKKQNIKTYVANKFPIWYIKGPLETQSSPPPLQPLPIKTVLRQKPLYRKANSSNKTHIRRNIKEKVKIMKWWGWGDISVSNRDESPSWMSLNNILTSRLLDQGTN